MDTQFDCFSYVKQEFLVCVTVHKARSLCVFNADTYVKVSIDKRHKSTKTFQNSENPYFNEYFVFEIHCTLPELLRQTISFHVFKKGMCKRLTNLGEIYIDLVSIWTLPGHACFKKWGKLENPVGQKDDAERGYIQIDLSIVSKNEPPAPATLPTEDTDIIEKNLIQPEYEKNPQHNIKYFINVYNGFFMKKGDYVVQVSFAGISGKTKPKKGSSYVEWNEQISFSWYHPSLCEVFLIQVMSPECMKNKTLSEIVINFDSIGFDDHFPCMGPSHIHLYDQNDPTIYIGRILISLESEKLESNVRSMQRAVSSNPISPIDESSFWTKEQFVIAGLFCQGDFLHSSTSNIKLSFTFAEFTSTQAECFTHTYTTSKLQFFKQEPPYKMLRIDGHFPDHRLNFEADFFMKDLIIFMKTQLKNFNIFQLKYANNKVMHAKCLKAIIVTFKDKIPAIQKSMVYSTIRERTEWDGERLQYFVKYFSNLQDKFDELRKMLKSNNKHRVYNVSPVYKELTDKIEQIEGMLSGRCQDQWPRIIIHLQISGKNVAYCQLESTDFIFSTNKNCRGRFCGQRQNFIFKPTNCHHNCQNCGCIYGKIDGCIWIGTEEETKEFLTPEGWHEQEPLFYYSDEESRFDCNVYIHQAKIRPGADKTGLSDAKVRATLLHLSEDTRTVNQSLAPIWDEVIAFHSITLPGPFQSYENNPPLIAIELFDVDTKSSHDYMGCGLVRPFALSLAEAAKKTQSLLHKVIPNDGLQSNDPRDFEGRSKDPEGIHSIVKTKTAMKRLKRLVNSSPPILKWFPVAFDGIIFAEILISAEILQIPSDMNKPEAVQLTQGLPAQILPTMRRYKIEVIFAGLRHFRKHLFRTTVGRYRIQVLFGELLLSSGFSGAKTGESINFLDMYATGIVSLPEQLECWPSIIITQVDCSSSACGCAKSDKGVTIGAAMLSKPVNYLRPAFAYCNPTKVIYGAGEQEEEDVEIVGEFTPLIEEATGRTKRRPRSILTRLKNCLTPKPSVKKIKEGEEHSDEQEKHETLRHSRLTSSDNSYTWWTKFYNSMEYDLEKDSNAKHTLVIYGNELEKQPEYNHFYDWAYPVEMVQGIQRQKYGPPKEEVYCTLKYHIDIRKCLAPPNTRADVKLMKDTYNSRFQELSTIMTEVSIVLRAYIVQGMRIRSKDRYNESDCFIKLQFGSKKISDRTNFVANQTNPVFGKLFQLTGVLPKEHILHISVYDRDRGHDQLIGCTSIDVEDRYRSQHRAGIGIAHEYSRSGYNAWRDVKTPLEILRELCKKHHLEPPEFIGTKIKVAGKTFKDGTQIETGESIRERLALSVLKKLDEIPEIGYKLVPEHVETRSLYRTDRAGIEQGKLQMWMEIYESTSVPLPIDITPIEPEPYELRVIIYNTADVILDEKNIFGKKMSDIYVKGWIVDIEEAQFTDIHFRSLNGEGNFNWRMIFTIKYSEIEDMMVVTRKASMFEQHDTNIKLPPVLYLQIWDNDTFSPDDFLGTLSLNLSHLRNPSNSAKSCTIKKPKIFLNLFHEKKIKGWFPTKGKSDKEKNKVKLTGKIEIELQLLTDAEATADPAGIGRDGPNALSPPNRPETSFNWYSNPMKSLKHIIVPCLKKCCIIICVVLVLFALVGLMLYQLPSNTFGYITRIFST